MCVYNKQHICAVYWDAEKQGEWESSEEVATPKISILL